MNKTVFIDTNILIDVLCQRKDFHEDSAAIWTLSEKGDVHGYISAISFNNIDYLIRRNFNRSTARKKMIILRDIFKIVALDQQIINQAIDSDIADFEDAIQYFSAIHINAECIITRDKKDFAHSEIPILSPTEFLKL